MTAGIPSVHPHVNLRSGVSCSCLIGRDHEESPRYSETEVRLEAYRFDKDGVVGTVTSGGNGPTVQQLMDRLRPHGDVKTAEQAESVFDSFTSDVYRVHVRQTEAQLREMVQQAIKLVEENPRNEPMRTEISRPAVERMLVEDLKHVDVHGYALRLDSDLLAVARALFDAGWRPTIDRLVR